jgi:hypothetical protein
MLATVAALSALLFTSPAEAGRHKHHKYHKHNKKHVKVRVQGVHRHAPPAFVAPVRIHHRLRAGYRPFFTGEVWFRPHRHYHETYIFPVRTRHGVVYREYEYCRGDLFISNHISYHGRNVSFSVGF